MATLKQRLHRKNSSGTYDTIHLETGADCITGTLAIANGGTGATTAANARTNLGAAASSHNHSAANITSGTLPISRGGTGVTSIDALKSALGIGGGGSITDPPVAPVSIPNVGGTLSWAGKTWIVVHKVTGITFLGLNTLEGTVQCSLDQWTVGYIWSKLYSKCVEFATMLGLYDCDYVLDYMGSKIFVASYDQLNGDFSYFTDNSKRSLGAEYWTSSGHYQVNYSGMWFVEDDGNLNDGSPASSGYPTKTYGFRPFVALKT